VTNFQRIGARQVFPCWDEPAMRATFSITVIYPPQYTSWSNMQIQKYDIDQGNGWSLVIFHTTPPISPYRIGFVLIEKGITAIYYENNRPYAVIHHRDIITEDVKFAKMIIRKVTKYLQSKWNIPGMISETNHVIIPSLMDNAIQNWGLVCYT